MSTFDRSDNYSHMSPTPKSPSSRPLLPSSPTSSETNASHLFGLFIIVLSCVCFSLATFLIHVSTSVYNFPVQTALFLRGLIQTLLSFLGMLPLNFPHPISSLPAHLHRVLLFRAIIGALGMYCLFQALHFLPLANAITIFFFSPILTVFFSPIFLSEPIVLLDALAAITSFIGVILVVNPSSLSSLLSNSHSYLLGDLNAFCAAVFAAGVYTLLRYLGQQSVHFLVNVFVLGISVSLLSFVLGGFMTPMDMMLNQKGSVLAVGSAIAAFFGQCFLSVGFTHCPAGPAAILRNLDVPLAYLQGMILLHETPNWFSSVGSCLVVLGTLVVGVRKIVQA